MRNYIYSPEKYEKRLEECKVITKDIVRDVDVCVIGSGAGGAVVATKLTKAGNSVVLLERGGYYDGESMNQREEDMIPLLWKNAGANFTANLKMAIAQGSCLGGSTVINDAVCFRIPPIIIKEWQKLGISIQKSEWDKANKEVEKKIHVTKVKDNELNENARKLKQACDDFRLYGNTIAHDYNHRNCGTSISDKKLTECQQCGFCHLGCHYDTKQSMLVTYIHESLNDKKADYTVYCNCKADKITHKNGIATGIDGIIVDSSGNEKYRIRVNAKVVIVSAGAIASSILLQKSNIGNKNVGKGLALHPAPFVMGRFEDEIYGNRGIPMSYTCNEFGITNGVTKGGFLIESIFLPIFQMAVAIPGYSLDHLLRMNDYNRLTMAGIMVRDEPNGSVSLTYDDHPKVIYDLSRQTINDMARGLAILSKMWFSVGAKSIITSHRDIPELFNEGDIPRLKDAIRKNPDGLMLGSAHPQGGNKMGNDSDECIVDSDCKVFGFKNLYVCDASVFPTALGVNPQQTIMALATITANKIIKKLNKIIKKSNLPVTTPLSFGKTCHISQPRFCLSKTIGEQFAVTDHNKNLFKELGNSEKKSINKNNWSFDKKTLKIKNDVFWKGFYGRDSDIMTTSLRIFGGFYKRFTNFTGKSYEGITHPFETPVDARSEATEKVVPGYGTVIHLKYKDRPFDQAYDLLKMVDKNTIIGKAFMGNFPRGRDLFNFSMSRVYDIDFMTEDDFMHIFNSKDLSRPPKGKDMVGRWVGALVSDSAISPRSQIFNFESEDGFTDMQYSFANMLRGRSDVKISDTIFRMDDPTPFHDIIRMVTPNLAIGRWVSDWSNENVMESIVKDINRYFPVSFTIDQKKWLNQLAKSFSFSWPYFPKEFGLSFLGIENKNKESRVGLSFILKRTG